MSEPARRRATYEDLLRVPDHLVAEILDGDLFTLPRPATPHARAASILGGDLSVPFDRESGGGQGPGGWWILDEPELHLRDDIVVPDLAGWRRSRLPVLPDVAFVEIPPDWVCEVISLSTERIDRGRKLRIYGRERVQNLWFVNPIARTLEVLRLTGDLWTLAATFEGDATIHAEPFEAIGIDMSRWWFPTASPAGSE